MTSPDRKQWSSLPMSVQIVPSSKRHGGRKCFATQRSRLHREPDLYIEHHGGRRSCGRLAFNTELNIVYSTAQEASHSGLVHTLGKRACRKAPRVRISPPPQNKETRNLFCGACRVRHDSFKERMWRDSKAGAAWLRGGVERLFSRKVCVT